MPPALRSIFRWIRAAAVILFVAWHLTFLVLTNASVRSELIDSTIGRYESYLGLDQRWGMFSSPLWRRAPFPAVRITFADGSTVDVTSRNEPADMTSFTRFTDWRARKFEHYIVVSADEVQRHYPAMMRRFITSYVERWRGEHPDDPRRPVKGTLLRRDFVMPKPGERWERKPAPEVEEKVTVDLESTRP